MARGAYFLLIYPRHPICYRTCVLFRGLYIIKTCLSSPFGAKNTGLELLLEYNQTCNLLLNAAAAPTQMARCAYFFAYIPNAPYLFSNLCATSGFIYNKNFSSFTLRGKKHWARTDQNIVCSVAILLLWCCNPNPDGKRCLFFAYIPKGLALWGNPHAVTMRWALPFLLCPFKGDSLNHFVSLSLFVGATVLWSFFYGSGFAP